METIASLRHEIDQVHKELQALLVRRRDLTMAIWKIKQDQGLPFFNAEREEQIVAEFARLEQAHRPDLQNDPAFDELLKGVMNSILREYEKYLKSKFPADE